LHSPGTPLRGRGYIGGGGSQCASPSPDPGGDRGGARPAATSVPTVEPHHDPCCRDGTRSTQQKRAWAVRVSGCAPLLRSRLPFLGELTLSGSGFRASAPAGCGCHCLRRIRRTASSPGGSIETWNQDFAHDRQRMSAGNGVAYGCRGRPVRCRKRTAWDNCVPGVPGSCVFQVMKQPAGRIRERLNASRRPAGSRMLIRRS